MTQKQDPKTVKPKNKKNKKRDWSFYAIIVCLVIIAIPVTYLGFVIIQATGDRGKVIAGSRFDGDLEPSIDIKKLDPVKETIKGWENVQSVNVDLKTATVRITIAVSPEASRDQIVAHANSAKDAVYAIFPKEEYFTATDTKIMYDVEINVYNALKVTDENKDSFIYYQLTQLSNGDEDNAVFLSDTRSPEFVQSLIDAEAAKANEGEKVPADTETEGADAGDEGTDE